MPDATQPPGRQPRPTDPAPGTVPADASTMPTGSRIPIDSPPFGCPGGAAPTRGVRADRPQASAAACPFPLIDAFPTPVHPTLRLVALPAARRREKATA